MDSLPIKEIRGNDRAPLESRRTGHFGN